MSTCVHTWRDYGEGAPIVCSKCGAFKPASPAAPMANRNDEALRALLRQVYGMAAEGCESPPAAVRWCERIDELLHEGAASDEYAAYARDVPAATLALLTPRPEPAGRVDAFKVFAQEIALGAYRPAEAYARARELLAAHAPQEGAE